MTFDATSGAYKMRLREKPTSKKEVTEGRMDLPAGAAGQGHIVAFLPKPSLLKTELVSEGEDQFFVGDTARKARRYLWSDAWVSEAGRPPRPDRSASTPGGVLNRDSFPPKVLHRPNT